MFTQDDGTEIPEIGRSDYSQIHNLIIAVKVVENMLKNLKINKASVTSDLVTFKN